MKELLLLLKKHKWVLLLTLIPYSIWVFFWLVSANIIFEHSPLLKILFTNRETPSAFVVSYAASALDSLIFFSTVTAIITFIAARKPHEEKLHRKIEYIFDGAEVDNALNLYLAEQVSLLACISTATNRVFTISDICGNNSTLKISAKTDVQIKNIHNNHQYANDNMMFGITVDETVGANDIEKKVIGDVLGEVHDVSIIYNTQQPLNTVSAIIGSPSLTRENRKYEVTMPIKLDPQQNACYRTNCWMWQDINKPLTIRTVRFTQSQSIELHNHTKTDICVNAVIPNGKDFSEVIEIGCTKLIRMGITRPGDVVKIDFELKS